MAEWNSSVSAALFVIKLISNFEIICRLECLQKESDEKVVRIQKGHENTKIQKIDDVTILNSK